MKSPTRILFSVLVFLCFAASQAVAQNPAAEMSKAAVNFLTSLKPDQRTKAAFEMPSAERKNWNFVPKARLGLPMKDMTDTQRKFAQTLLQSGLSQRGYTEATTIMSLELVLFDMENKNAKRDPGFYYVSIFGNPAATNAWGWRVEGHHLSVNFTLAGQMISTTPMFMGSNPAEVRQGSRKGLRVLASEEDLGRKLVKSFSAEQLRIATFATNAPREIITGNSRQAKVLEVVGLPETKMTTSQRALLMKLIHEYLFRDRAEIADAELAKVEKAGLEKIYFGWAGGIERGQPHYYRVQGPTFLLEYDNTQNNANHIHTVWRDFANDFGEDVLREHYEQTKHNN